MIRKDLEEGRTYLERAGSTGARITTAPPQWEAVIIELTGRFPQYPDREVTATVELDPARVGWRIEAELYEYLDADKAPRLVRHLGSTRTADLAIALHDARVLATAAWVAVKNYPNEGDPLGG